MIIAHFLKQLSELLLTNGCGVCLGGLLYLRYNAVFNSKLG